MRWLAIGGMFAGATYLSFVGIAWLRFGRVTVARNLDASDRLLDRFMPVYEVVERHEIRVAAPAATTLAAAAEIDLFDGLLVRAIFKARELLLGSSPEERKGPRGLLAQTRSLGWGLLAEVPGREIVVGAVTKPWEPNVTFHAVPPEEFAAFREPGLVKIVWTLRADPIDDTHAVFRTETRVMTTDRTSRARFRRYWAFVSPGIRLIRQQLLKPVKTEAERRAREAGRSQAGASH